MNLLLKTFIGFNFLFGWLLTYVGLPYKPLYSSLFLLPSLRSLRFSKFSLFAASLFAASFVLSAFYNGSSIINTVLYFRYLFIFFVIIAITKTDLCSLTTITKSTLKWFISIQIVLLILQIIFKNEISNGATISLSFDDVRTGTFRLKGDAVMSTCFFFILYFFIKKSPHKQNQKEWLFFFILPLLGIFLGNSTMSKLLCCVFLSLRLVKFNVKILFLATVIGLSAFYFTGMYEDFVLPIISHFQKFSEGVSKQDLEKFLSGGYNRIAAIFYYSHYWTWLGDGPGASKDLITNTLSKGTTGQLLLFIDEIGLIGLTTSFLFIYAFTKNICLKAKNIFFPFFYLSALTVTESVSSDIGLWFGIVLIAKIFEKE